MGILSFIENIHMKTQEHQPVHKTKKGQEDAEKKITILIQMGKSVFLFINFFHVTIFLLKLLVQKPQNPPLSQPTTMEGEKGKKLSTILQIRDQEQIAVIITFEEILFC
eukprot:TRINITY_DN23061_c0_g2_i2.p1 TRINITY_DN23061_c0_g2~~TRINITY_DN23061_c0_g2_i2.p1  ORF type:complete len:118 (-),score=14.65 TRINITY_DN23061_c0_g2_i2:818-1144(-)